MHPAVIPAIVNWKTDLQTTGDLIKYCKQRTRIETSNK